jgi:hypothetical protein
MSLNPNAVPSANFDLSDWKLQLPIDTRGSFSGKAAEVKTLTSYVHQDYFYTGSDGAMVLAAPVDGATTGGSIYARSELREMNGTANAEWSLQQGGHLSATLQVDAAPRHDDGTYGKVVVGQVHGGDGQLVRLAWEDGTLFFANDITSNGTKDVHIELLNAQGKQPSVSLNETFTYHIDVSADRLVVSVIADGQVYSSSSSINDAWNDNSFYFKAGAYLGVNENNGSGSGQVSIFAVDATHTGDSEPLAPEVHTVYCTLPAWLGDPSKITAQAATELNASKLHEVDASKVPSENSLVEPLATALFGDFADDSFVLRPKSDRMQHNTVDAVAQGTRSDLSGTEFDFTSFEAKSGSDPLQANGFDSDASLFSRLVSEAPKSHSSFIDLKVQPEIFSEGWAVPSTGFDLF